MPGSARPRGLPVDAGALLDDGALLEAGAALAAGATADRVPRDAYQGRNSDRAEGRPTRLAPARFTAARMVLMYRANSGGASADLRYARVYGLDVHI